MNVLLALPTVLGLLGAGLSMALYRRPYLQRWLGGLVLAGVLGVSIALLVQVEADGPAATQLGGWPAPLGITLYADLFSALLLVVGAATVLAVFAYAVAQPGTDEVSAWFHPVYLVLSAGISASFLAGDLFNLFVAFEIMLIASYVLLTLGATRDQVRTGMTYVVINLVDSVLFVVALGLLYAAVGTVNMADLVGKVGDLPPGLREGLGLLFLVVFGTKAGLFPLFFWLPDSYPTAPTPVTAVFAGLLTKVGVYTIIRSQTLIFGDGRSSLVLWVAGLTMVVGVLGALAQDDIKRLLSFHIVSQIGYMVLGLGLFTAAGLAAATYFILHQIVVKTSLFLVGGLVEHLGGTAALRRLGGFVRSSPLLALLFALPALSLAGIPPFSGFVGKLALVDAGLEVDAGIIVGVSLAVSVLTLLSMSKIWAGVFWGEPEDPTAAVRVADGGDAVVRAPSMMVASTIALVALSVAIAVFAGPLYDLCERAGVELLDRDGYVRTVVGA